MQCWWLSILEVARASGKLNHIFTVADGKLYKYYEKGDGAGLPKPTPAVNDLPPGAEKHEPPPTPDREVYGPAWQRMIMYFLWDKAPESPFHPATKTLLTSLRPEQLKNLLDFLGVAGITLEKSSSSPAGICDALKKMDANRRVVVDRKGLKGGRGHAMSGIVEADPHDPKGRQVVIYNQANAKSYLATIQKVDGVDNLAYIGTDGATYVVNWFLPLDIATTA